MVESQKKELCIIHIGMPKTGSSTLQEAFFKGLSDTRVSYGNLPNPNQSGWTYGLFVKDSSNYHFFKEWGIDTQHKIDIFREESKKLLVEGFKSHKTSIEILSGEDLFHLHEEGVRELKSFLTPYFKRVIVVAYVRPVKSFLESAFQQRVKHLPLNSLDIKSIYHRYKNLESYDKVFGLENVKLFKFDPSTFPEGDIVLDFCQKLNLKSSKSEIKVVNESISKESVSILFTYHFHANVKTDFGAKVHIVQNRLVELLRGIGTNKFRFSNQYMANVLETFKDDYAWIQNRIKDSLEEALDANDTSGISNEHQLMEYSTNYIDDLVKLLDTTPIPFELLKHPQTVAKLVDLLMRKIYNEMNQKVESNNR